jgi:hypothetical protein
MADFSSSVYDGYSNVYACGYSTPSLYRINVDTLAVTAISLSGTIGNVYSLAMYSCVAQNSNLYIFGDNKYLSIDTFKGFSNVNSPSNLRGKFATSNNNEIFTYAEVPTPDTINVYSLYNTNFQTIYSVGVINAFTGAAIQGLGPFPPQQVSLMSSLGVAYGNYCANVQVSNVSYYVPSTFKQSFAQGTPPSQFVTLPVSQSYAGGSTNGRYVYMYPASGFRNLVQFEALPRFTMFVPFCTDSTVDPSGSLNFSRVALQVPGATSGSVYAVNHNILRFRDGMAGLLYAC